MAKAGIKRAILQTVLTRDELVEFERGQGRTPEQYDYRGVMTDDEINRLIEMLARKKENFELAARHAQQECADYKAKYEASERENTRKDKVIRKQGKLLAKKDRELEKSEKENADLKEQLSDAKAQLYGDRQQKAKPAGRKEGKTGGKDGEKEGGRKDDDDKPESNPGGADRQQAGEECDGATPQEPVTEDKSCDGVNPSATGCTFDPANRPESYQTMSLSGDFNLEDLKQMKLTHRFDRSQLPEGTVIEDARYERFYDLTTVLTEHRREKLRVRKPGQRHSEWIYAPLPGEEKYQAFMKTKASAGFMQALAYEHIVKHVTVGAIRRMLLDLGMTISKTTLLHWLRKGKKAMEKLILELKDKALEKDCILNCDETWCKVRRKNKYTKKYMWVLVNRAEKIVIFFYDEGSRGRKVLTDFLGDAEIEAVMTDGYNAYTFLDGVLETDHLICMAHARAKFTKALNQGKDAMAKEFLALIAKLYALEDRYKREGFSPHQIYLARQSQETEAIERRLRSLVAQELSREDPGRSYYMRAALTYFDRFKDGLFLYRKNGKYPIDNNLAERQVRPFAAQRKASEHFGSDEGAEVAAAYHSIVSTVLLKGKSIWKFFGVFFEDVVTGRSNHRAFLGLATA